MAETQQQAETRLRSEYPPPQFRDINGENVAMTTEEYDAWITSSATAQIAGQLAAEEAAALAELRRQVRVARTRLQAIAGTSGNFPNATARDNAIKDTAQILNGLIGVLIDLDLIERE